MTHHPSPNQPVTAAGARSHRRLPLVAAAVLALAFAATAAAPASGDAPGAPVPASLSCGTTTPIAYGAAPTAGAIPVPGASACFTYVAAAGDAAWSDLADTSGDLSLFEDVYDPAGVSMCAGPYTNPGPCGVPAGDAGTWTIEVTDEFGTHTGTFDISVQRLDDGVGCHPISFGKNAKSEKLKAPAASSCLSFTGTSGAVLFARAVGYQGTLGLPSLLVGSPDGSEACLPQELGVLECSLTESGTETLLAYSTSGATTGSFRVYLQQLTHPEHCTGLVAGGAAKPGDVAKAGDVACFTFAGVPGETFTVTLSGLTGTLQPLIDFFDPAGASSCANFSDSLSCETPSSGTWTILVDDASSTETGTGSFTATLAAS